MILHFDFKETQGHWNFQSIERIVLLIHIFQEIFSVVSTNSPLFMIFPKHINAVQEQFTIG